MNTATIALVIAIIALVLVVGHIFTRDSDHGGRAHTFGFGKVPAIQPGPVSNDNPNNVSGQATADTANIVSGA